MRIYSYFSLPTDLAGAMRDWPEFVSGEDYDVELKNDSTNEKVSVNLIERSKDEQVFVRISANRKEGLYERVVGRVIIELQPHTDNLMIENMD